MAEQSLVPVERLEQAIIVIRGHKVLLDTDVAALYGVETRRLNEQVRRNAVRFPPDFMFQLTAPELENLKSQIATSSSKWEVNGSCRLLSQSTERSWRVRVELDQSRGYEHLGRPRLCPIAQVPVDAQRISDPVG